VRAPRLHCRQLRDVVFESNTLEHFPDKSVLTRVVREVHRKIKPGGRFILLQPNIRYTGGAYWDFYDHFIPLTHLSCAELLQNCGFRIERRSRAFCPTRPRARCRSIRRW